MYVPFIFCIHTCNIFQILAYEHSTCMCCVDREYRLLIINKYDILNMRKENIISFASYAFENINITFKSM